MNTKQVKYEVPKKGHEPIVVVEDYFMFDGHFANKTDTQCLSVGHAQYDDSDPKEISAKVFRHTGKRWSPQSEELPLHRCVDLTNLIVQSIMRSENILCCIDKGEIKSHCLKEDDLHYISEIYRNEDTKLREKLKELNFFLNILLTHDCRDNNK